VTLCNIS